MVRIIYVFIFLMLSFLQLIAQNVTCKEYYYIISDNKEDSLFCAKHYPYYDFDNESTIYGIMTPEKLIQGKDMPLIDILFEVKNQILRNFSDFDEDKVLSISILVDNKGIVKGGITNNNQTGEYKILRYAYDALKKYNYIPAYNRGKPVNFCFSFIIKLNIENNVSS